MLACLRLSTSLSLQAENSQSFRSLPNRKKQTLSKQQLPQKCRQLTSGLCCLDRQADWAGDLSLEPFGTVWNCPHRGRRREFKPAMLSFLGPESLGLQLLAKLRSHWQLRGIYIPLCHSGSRFLHKGPFFLFPKGVSPAGCAVSSLLARGWLDSAVTSPSVVGPQ